MEKNTVSSHFVRAALTAMSLQDNDKYLILKECGIEEGVLDLPQSRVTAVQFAALWLAVARHLDDEFFGQDSHRMKSGSFAMLCNMLIHCNTLKSALVQMLRFFNLLLDDYACELVPGVQYSHIRITERISAAISAQGTRQKPRIFGHETLLIFQHGIACWLIGRRIPIVVAGFCYPEPDYSQEYHYMYSYDLKFNQPFTSLTFDTSYLRLPLIQNELTVGEFIKNAPANIVLKYKNHSGYSATIRKMLRATPIVAWPDFYTVASQLNMTRSTLRRRLEEEGQAFQAIKDQLRRDLAMTALSQSTQSIVEISNELGFAEPSAFYRAFKKWMNCSPAKYRDLTVIKAQ